MGILDLLSGGTRRLMQSATLPFNPHTPGPDWPQFVVDDVTQGQIENLQMSRAVAMTIPSVVKARNLLVSAIAKYPLKALRANSDGTDTDVTNDNAWLYRTNGPVSPYERMAWTVDDVIFYGVSLWLVDRGAPVDGRAPILNAAWTPRSTWKIDVVDEATGEMGILVLGSLGWVPLAEDRYILFNSPFEGLLTLAQRTLSGALDTEKAWTGRLRNPIPLIDLHRVDDGMTDAEVKALVADWSAARTKENGAIGSTPPSVEVKVFGELKHELFVEGRNAIRTDIGSFLNIRVAMLDGTIGIDSLTYSTKDGEANAFYEFDLPFWTDPIVDRLSQDDVVARGTRIRFEKYSADNLPVATGPRVED